jgi:hypothetical protein
MKPNICKRLVSVVAVIAFVAGVAGADGAALQEKLKQDVQIELEDVTIVEALDRIGAQADITIELSDEAAWKLPAGRETRLSVTLEGRLGEGLEQMLNEFLQRYAVGSESVVVLPRPELRRILGRPTPQLLRLLKNMYTRQMRLSGNMGRPSSAQAVVNMLAGESVTVFPLNEFENVTHVIGIIAERNQSSDDVSSTSPTTPVTLATILEETIGRRDDSVWLVSPPEFPDQPAQIRIVRRLDYGKAVFGQVVDVSFQDEEGLSVLRKLAGIANIELEIIGEDRPWVDRGWLQQRITLDALNVTVREALNRVTHALGGQVGTVNYERCSYEVSGPPTQTSATLGAPPAGAQAPSPTAVAPSGDDYVGKISIPVGEGEGRYFIEFMLRERDLPDGLRRLRAEKIKEIFESFPNVPETSQQ